MGKCILSYKQPVYTHILVQKSTCKLRDENIHVNINAYAKYEFGYRVTGKGIEGNWQLALILHQV